MSLFGPYLLQYILILLIQFEHATQNLLFDKRKSKISPRYLEDLLSNFTPLTGAYGYVFDKHRVITEDGYILTVFRVTGAKHCHGEKRSPPVLLMHGLLQSSDSLLAPGPSTGLPYLISDGCYDLWVGNCRGNYHSRSHIMLNPDQDPEFWQFDIEEIGKYDVPTTMDYVLKHTGSKKLNYIGFSQGAGTYLVMCSERPEYCNKTQIFIALAPASRHFYTKSFIFRFITEFSARFETTLAKSGLTEIFAKGGIFKGFLASYCRFSYTTLKICEEFLHLLDYVHDFHRGSRTDYTTRNIFIHSLAGTSLHNMARYDQSMRKNSFCKFDYGAEENLKRYGSVKPPNYNLSAVSVPVFCIYGQNDGIVDIKDVQWLLSKLPNVLESFKVKDPLWTHLDMVYSRNTKEVLMPKIDEYLKKYSSVSVTQ